MAKVSMSEHFDVHASVVYQLGEELITDTTQALVELVKNSYDADATYCKVNIITGSQPPPETEFLDSNGWIVVEDDGSGMNKADIKRGWLTISDSAKRQFKRQRLTTGKGRTPLGDKGLGRLGAQRLGQHLEMFTRKKDSDGFHLTVKWEEFAKYERLSEVPISFGSDGAARPTGTKLIISTLVNAEAWRGDALEELQRRLSQLISPYQEVRDFQVYAIADGKTLDLAEISAKLRNAAQLAYTMSFDGELFKVGGKAKFSYFRPQKETDRALFADLIEKDGGAGFVEYLHSQTGWKRFSVDRSSSAKWFLEFGFSKELEAYSEMERVDGVVANPGEFKGEVDSFNLAAGGVQGVFDSAAELKKVVARFSGIRVYRDGFGVRVNPDWLNLAAQWTGGGSWYGLRPQNTLGYVAISARHNDTLRETTDREGFKETPHYLNFYELLQSFVVFAADAQEFFRRSWSDYRKLHQKIDASVASDSTAESVAQDIAEALSRSASYRTSLRTVSEKLNRSVESTQRHLAELSRGGKPTHIRNDLERLRDTIKEASSIVKEVETYLEELRAVEKKAQVVTEQIRTLREQIEQVYETIGMGMTAEALTHELENIATQLAERTQDIGNYARSQVRDSRIIAYVAHVKTAIAEFRRQLTFLAPSLKYVRDQREEIEATAFVKELVQYYTKRFVGTSIVVESHSRSRTPFRISINRGKLIQIFDNVLLNSEYWLKDDLKARRTNRGVISIETDRPFIRVSDNGRGVDPLLEDSVFEAFVSAKGRGKGRGLGLYIVQQLLGAEGCSIALLPDRNKYDRRFVFEIDFSGVLSESADSQSNR